MITDLTLMLTKLLVILPQTLQYAPHAIIKFIAFLVILALTRPSLGKLTKNATKQKALSKSPIASKNLGYLSLIR